RRLAATIGERFRVDDDLLLFCSGGTGFHVGVNTRLWDPPASADFNRVARRFAESVAGRAGVKIDAGVYDKVRPCRGPNSRHPKTGLHKRKLAFDELAGLSLDALLRLAQRPEPFEVSTPSGESAQAAADWRDAEEWVRQQAEAKAQRRAAGTVPTLNRLTLDF